MAKDQLVTARLSQLQIYHFDTLSRYGYGDDRTEVAEYLIQRALDDLIRSGVLQVR